MSDRSNESPNTKGTENDSADVAIVPAPPNDRFETPFPPALQGLLDLEKQRIESTNQRTNVVRYAIETNDASDKRQYEYQMAKLAADTTADTRRHNLMRTSTITFGAATVLGLSFLFGMAFFGTPQQSEMAFSVLKVLGTGGAGYGVVAGISSLMRRLSN